jgi:hypothetical protein
MEYRATGAHWIKENGRFLLKKNRGLKKLGMEGTKVNKKLAFSPKRGVLQPFYASTDAHNNKRTC